MDRRTAPRFGQYLGSLAAQLLHARSDYRKVVVSAGSGALAAQLLHACPNHRKIFSGAGWVTFPPFSCDSDIDEPTAAISSIRLGILPHTLPTHTLPGQQMMSSAG
jgi:hypothetical protein